jgi:hypothetical protein
MILVLDFDCLFWADAYGLKKFVDVRFEFKFSREAPVTINLDFDYLKVFTDDFGLALWIGIY